MVTTLLSLLAQTLAVPFSAEFWARLLPGLKEIWQAIKTLLCRLKRGEWEGRRRPERSGCCIDVPPDVYKRADPLIYSQYYLMAQGLAVTWDNPDIDIFDGTVPVTGPLKPRHLYRVRVRIWNGSYDAPAIGMGVALSYLSFGAQTQSHPIGMNSVNLGAKGTIDHPAFSDFLWETPETGGHYCLQAQLFWSDDANPNNNLGQKNVNVAQVQSPARFSFTVRNDASVPRRFVLEADTYMLPELPPCRETAERPKTRREESRLRWDATLREQGVGRFPVPDDWSVEITPDAFGLDAGQELSVDVAIEPADIGFSGAKTFNVHVFALGEQSGRSLAGGVTLTATRS